MTTQAKECKSCGEQFDKEDLSKQGLCYECAKARMIKAFDTMWFINRKKED